MKIQELQQLYSKELTLLYSENEIQKLFTYFAEEYLQYNSIQLKMYADQEVEEAQKLQFTQALEELKSGKPYQQILGKAYFYGEEFFVNENVLIPRPETEELIELILEKLPSDKELKILDIGTGSGCIAITIAKHLKHANVYALDYSKKALEMVKKNAVLHNVNIHFIQQDYLNTELSEVFDVIISNPPYIGTEEEVDIENSVKDFEPMMALFAPQNDVLAFYRKIANDTGNKLADGGFVFLEINQKLGPETLKLYKNKLSEAYLLKDISDNDRMIWGRK
ncbi:protein-(glutamine-N5) methyltransferase, release factor-specific [Elizabethkingia sp. HvH-WGS333]|uniref:peptide chain release factor N(5)-glutamine methyltransferase n=1 Tax=Elizabethkingia TaxID=308865 RepID=UPI000741531D|nr:MULTISPECIES: peptide chain release factor N(5)-glutamine methyltransferase [Elizabethkingia]KUG12137.1 protein-(glutamine-N5) methyltransferase [Elizabethkingia miricola]MCL1655202.1 peptide chain release factor N(5)-glutamine methyltransferase [Elizabethkingia miricola]OIK47322.1 protein-(glutamine-N5) methyltransferase, release factor-specific [Elizabethkingia sp. HvH-WGS333]